MTVRACRQLQLDWCVCVCVCVCVCARVCVQCQRLTVPPTASDRHRAIAYVCSQRVTLNNCQSNTVQRAEPLVDFIRSARHSIPSVRPLNSEIVRGRTPINWCDQLEKLRTCTLAEGPYREERGRGLRVWNLKGKRKRERESSIRLAVTSYGCSTY